MEEGQGGGKDAACTVKAILFDFGGVLAEEGFRNGLMEIARERGLEPDAFFKKGSDLIHRSGYVTGRTEEGDYWTALRRETGIQGDDVSLRRVIFDHFILRDWMMDIVKSLRAANVLVAILSDQTNWLDELNDQYDFFKWFDYVFNSYHSGKGKRDPTLFDDVLGRMHVDPPQALFVDDNGGNIERAKTRGLKTIRYTGREDFEEALASYCPFLVPLIFARDRRAHER